MPPMWIAILVGIGAGLAAAVLFHHTDTSISSQVLTVASNIVSGAFGAAAGHAAATLMSRKTTVPGDPPVTIEEKSTPTKE